MARLVPLYIGASVYVTFDGCLVTLFSYDTSANDTISVKNEIILDRYTMEMLITFYQRCLERIAVDN